MFCKEAFISSATLICMFKKMTSLKTRGALAVLVVGARAFGVCVVIVRKMAQLLRGRDETGSVIERLQIISVP